MDLMRLGTALHAIRVRRRMRLDDLARATGVSRSVIARLERDEAAGTSLRTVETIARGLGATVDIYVRWHGADLDRLINARQRDA